MGYKEHFPRLKITAGGGGERNGRELREDNKAGGLEVLHWRNPGFPSSCTPPAHASVSAGKIGLLDISVSEYGIKSIT